MVSDMVIVCYVLLLAAAVGVGVFKGADMENDAWQEKICLEKSGIYHEGKCFKEEIDGM